MTSIGSPSPFFFGGKKAYEVERSLRFNKGDNPVLTRSPSSTTNSTKQTLSFWFKISSLLTSNNQGIMFAGGSNGSWAYAQFYQGTFYFGNSAGPYWMGNLTLRDFSAWYHAVIVIDTTLSTSNDRQKLYINGVQQERNSGSSDPSQNANYEFFTNSSWTYYIGKRATNDFNFDGYMTEINFVQGLALDASYFGETDSITGQWNPKKYTGSYGTNGFYLNFSDNSALGTDSSGNGNNFTPNNFSVSAGVGNDSLEDTPTNNFPTLNPLYNPVNSTLSEGNLLARGGDNFAGSTFLLPKSGKWYVEFSKYGNGALQSISVTRANTAMTNYDGYLGLADNVEYVSNGELGNRSRGSTSDATAWTSDADIVVAAAVDMDNGAVYFARANTWQNSGDPTSGSSKTGAIATDLLTDNNGDHIIAVQGYNGSISYGMYVNFGQRPFTYTPPTGYKSLCSANLPDPTIKLPNKHFDTLLYTGNGSSQTISGLNFAPDWVWIKNRNSSSQRSHILTDRIRGATKSLLLPETDAETTQAQDLSAFTSDGFSVGNYERVNENSKNLVAWNWNAGDTDGKTYVVKVHDFSGNNRYIFDDFQTQAVTLDLAEGGSYIFDLSDGSVDGHPMKFSATSNGSHGGGTTYSTGVTYILDGVEKSEADYVNTTNFNAATSRLLKITVAASAPTLYYFCHYHSGMGGQINTNSTLGSSNFDGTIQATVKANATAGFSIVSYTGNGTSGARIGHGLGAYPTFTIVKNRDSSTNWPAINFPLQIAGQLNTNQVFSLGNFIAYFGGALAEPTYIQLGTHGTTNTNSDDYIAYVFSEVAGYSKFGSYTGNGSSDGPFVFTGFRPAWIMIKRTDSGSQNWLIHDIKRDPHNVANKKLAPNLSFEENNSSYIGSSSQDTIDILSNGFKMRSNNNHTNISGGTFIYLAFAESPFKYARAR